MSEDTDWGSANCISVGTEPFYEAVDTRAVRDRVCGRCPIRQECLDHAIETEEPWGIWGGKSPRERLTLIRIAKDDPTWKWPRSPNLDEYVILLCAQRHELVGDNVFIDHRGSRCCRLCYQMAVERDHTNRRSKGVA